MSPEEILGIRSISRSPNGCMSRRTGSNHFRQLMCHQHGKLSQADSMIYHMYKTPCPVSTVRFWDCGVRFHQDPRAGYSTLSRLITRVLLLTTN